MQMISYRQSSQCSVAVLSKGRKKLGGPTERWWSRVSLLVQNGLQPIEKVLQQGRDSMKTTDNVGHSKGTHACGSFTVLTLGLHRHEMRSLALSFQMYVLFFFLRGNFITQKQQRQINTRNTSFPENTTRLEIAGRERSKVISAQTEVSYVGIHR